MVTGTTDIYQSLFVLFGTRIGERVLTLEYGTDLTSFVFTSLPLAEKADLIRTVRDAVILYEPRIILHECKVDDGRLREGVLSLELDFTIDTVNSRHNMVFPFFIHEGTLLPDL